MFYMGLSMYPLFIPGDILHIKPYDNTEIKVGDVVVFKAKNEEKNIVHRVVSINNSVIITRGDNNNHADSGSLIPEDIIGKVIIAERDAKKRSVPGGMPGFIRSEIIRYTRRINKNIIKILRPFYHFIAQTSFLKQWFSGKAKIRIISFRKPSGNELLLLMGSYLIGRLAPGSKNWWIRKPFRLFLNEKSLPVTEEKL